jgi:hypothetical protein
MQDKRIIYPNDEGGVSIIVPSPGQAEDQLLTAVPAGKPYQIVDVADIPADRTFRNAWTYE